MPSDGLLEPRDHVSAGRTGAAVTLLAAGAMVGYEVLGAVLGLSRSTPTTLVQATVIGSVLVLAGTLVGSVPDRVPRWVWTAGSVLGVAVVLWLGLVTHDSRAAGQIGFIYPVVFAAANLRAPVAWTVSALAASSDVVLSVVVLPAREAVADAFVMTAALAMVTAALQMVADRQDALTGRLSEIAAIDQLTGLASRRRLEEVAHEVLATPCPAEDLALGTGLAIVDLDHFKALNDTYGHPVGDAALVHVAALLRTSCPSKATVARLGGDELAVLLPCGPPEEVGTVMERFHDAVRTSPMNHLGRVLALSVSVGGTHVPAMQEPDLAVLYARADEALYQAKLQGRGRVVVE
ncbi:GGDEF domain-containing protein [Isoptericola sp. b441]|uniref:GGDEF domain-containing protein n=1 Tax=Actinotalea lenta TaxID=3064654 RepID=A0ABT9D6H3_9CELL|nr:MULTISPECIES: GGDEF domain-containing protein [unclassified Isoptericola]MDO8106440.1 GGDEF domain-containing protein [Isoptericola sp. b441]MDO8121844.1 GGDEF domain-containing protein [Isoptericola sp. b490]